MSQSLAQLQAEWRNTATRYLEQARKCNKRGERDAAYELSASAREADGYADALSPHVEREAAAQAKSLADDRRIKELREALQFAEAAIDAAREVYRIKGDLPGYELMGVALSKTRAALRVGDAT